LSCELLDESTDNLFKILLSKIIFVLYLGVAYGEKTNLNTSERGNISVSAVVWFTNTDDDESEKNYIFFK
jgi:hypothetical protein